jgi:hypothetical protein
MYIVHISIQTHIQYLLASMIKTEPT